MKIIKRFASLLLALALLLLCGGLYLRSSVFPVKHESVIETYCERFEVSKTLILAMIKTESNWKTDATSPKNACGLLQLQPKTLEWLVTKLDEDKFENLDIYDVNINLKYGIYYIDMLLDRFGNINTALAAYNAGPTNVDKWLIDSRYSKDGCEIKATPFGETNRYMNKIATYMAIYKYLYLF